MYLQNSLPGVYITNVADMAEISVYLTSEMWQESIPYFIVQYNNIIGSYKVRRRRKTLSLTSTTEWENEKTYFAKYL